MKKIMCILIMVCGYCTVQSQTIYEQTVKDIDGKEISLNRFAGKKILVVIAPAREDLSGKLQDLAAFKEKYKENIHIVGLLSYDHDYADSNKASIIEMYRKMNIDITLTEPVHTLDSKEQTGIVRWLTTGKENRRKDVIVYGTYQKFFIDTKGRLQDVVMPEVLLKSDMVKRIMQRK